MHKFGAFTLIELLVVITIIVILLSLLTPAMDTAIYRAELLQCSARQRAACSSMASYAASNSRFYARHRYSSAYTLKESTDLFRPIIRDYMSINDTLNDPFVPQELDLDRSPAVAVSSSYQLWFGYGYSVGGEKGMYKLGDRWTYSRDGTQSARRRFSILTNDTISGTLAAGVSSPSGSTYTYHNDQGNSMGVETRDNEKVPTYGGLETPNGPTYTFSRWRGPYTSETYFDMNYGYEDGSVKQLNDITIDGLDDRIVPVPVYHSKASSEATVGFYVAVE